MALLLADTRTRDALGVEFRHALEAVATNTHARTTVFKAVLAPDPDLSRPPIKFADFNTVYVEYFTMWIKSLKKADGSLPSFSTLNLHQLFNLFRDFKQTKSPELYALLSSCFKGTKRELVDAAQAGEIPVMFGKDPLSVALSGQGDPCQGDRTAGVVDNGGQAPSGPG